MKLITKLFIFSILIACPVFVFAENQFPSFPMAFWGTATIDSQSLPSGTKIQAFCSNSLIGEVTMSESGIYGYANSTKMKLLASSCSGDILFKYILSGTTTPLTGTSQIKYTDGFQEGTTINKNLNFISVTVPITPPAGGGGGGGGNTTMPPITITTKAGDANGDGKVDKYDFALMMSNWGKIGTNVCDFNGDGKVDKYDFALLMSKWGI